MSITTTVLENGQWITRSVDPYQLQARNQLPEEKIHRHSLASNESPSLGVLTQTLIRASIVKWIIPARVRHLDCNDVLFITDSSVEIKEAHGDCTLNHVIVKTDFDSVIRSASIMGLPRRLTKSDEKWLALKEEQYWLPKHDLIAEEVPQSEGAQGDTFVKREDGASRSSSSSSHLELPPQILVLVLESRKLLFLYAATGRSQRPVFRVTQIALSSTSSRSERLGEHLAIDPRSRAIAVAAHEKSFCLYAMKSMIDLRREFWQTSTIDPVRSVSCLRPMVFDGGINIHSRNGFFPLTVSYSKWNSCTLPHSRVTRWYCYLSSQNRAVVDLHGTNGM